MAQGSYPIYDFIISSDEHSGSYTIVIVRLYI
jgi:hypothetical protein